MAFEGSLRDFDDTYHKEQQKQPYLLSPRKRRWDNDEVGTMRLLKQTIPDQKMYKRVDEWMNCKGVEYVLEPEAPGTRHGIMNAKPKIRSLLIGRSSAFSDGMLSMSTGLLIPLFSQRRNSAFIKSPSRTSTCFKGVRIT